MTARISPGTAAPPPVSPARAARFAGLARYQGRPVPAITLWSGRTVPVHRPGEGWVWDCECVPGRGTPQLGSVCPARQRQLMTGRRCQMCGHPVTGEPYWITGTEHGAWLRDPPFHASCGRYALAACPGLQLPLRDPSTSLRIIGCDDYDIAFTTEDGDDYYTAGEAAAASGKRNLVKWAWARPSAGRVVYRLAEWAEVTSQQGRRPDAGLAR